MMMTGLGAAGNAAEDRKTNYYLLQNYFLKNGTQLARIHEFLSQGFLPALKTHPGPKIFLEAMVAPHQPQVAAIVGLRSLEEMAGLNRTLNQEGGYKKAFSQWESGPEAPYEHYSQTVLKAADYSPEVASSAADVKPRIFELRVYHSPTWKQLAALHQRFAGPEIRIFHRVGVHPIFYSETAAGANMPNLTYLIPFESLAAREKAWDAFAADPEWIKVRKESIEAHGQISSVIQITLWRATTYSLVR